LLLPSVPSVWLIRSTKAVAGHLRVLGLEIVPAKPRRSWWQKEGPK